MFNFTNPAAFLLFLLLPVYHILHKLKIFNRISFTAVLADWEGYHFEWKGRYQKIMSAMEKLFLGAGVILVVIAFADPVISSREKVYTTLGTDVVFVVDTSPSMAAKDINGSMRIEAAKNAIYTLSQNNTGCRFGIVGLGSNASVLVPPTTDLATFTQRLSQITVGLYGNGSAIGDGLSTAVCHLASSTAPKKCIILLTDGENNAGEIHPETAVKLAAENAITVYVVGVGSKGTVPIEYTDPITGKQYSGYLDSDFNSSSLKKIASIGKGRYFEVRSLEELSATLNTVAKIEEVSQSFTYRTINKTYYQKFLLVAIILLALSWFIKHVLLQEIALYKFKKILYFRTGILFFGFIMLILAYSGISWGTYLVPVQKSGSSVSMVFDISNSMLAKDGPEKTTRLKAATIYAKKLISKMEGTSTSVVVAKGDGITAIPLTQDTAIIESLMDVLSPNLSTVPGTSLGKGILKAKESLSNNHSSAGRIWLFTDGEETDGQLENAFVECLKSGVPVTVIGFGSEQESDILAGDNITHVKTALRSEKIKETIEHAAAKYNFYGNRNEITYINSTDKGSAITLINQLGNLYGENLITSYEVKPVPRYKFFLLLSILTFIFSYIMTEVDFKHLIKKSTSLAALCIFVSIFSGCSSDTTKILNGTFAYHKKQYRHAVSEFIQAAENAGENNDQLLMDYSLYDLGTAYLMLGEDSAALERFASVSTGAPDKVRYAAYYNAGVLSHQKGEYEAAKDYFRKALEIDSSSIEAKINFELSMQGSSQSAKQNESNAVQGSSEESDIKDIQNAVFERIKENDQKQWKNSESNQSQNLANDY